MSLQTRLLALATVSTLPEGTGLESCTAGDVYDVAGAPDSAPVQALLSTIASYSDADSSPAAGSALILLGPSGSVRPIFPRKGQMFVDTSVSSGTPLWWTGSAWVDASGASH